MPICLCAFALVSAGRQMAEALRLAWALFGGIVQVQSLLMAKRSWVQFLLPSNFFFAKLVIVFNSIFDTIRDLYIYYFYLFSLVLIISANSNA